MRRFAPCLRTAVALARDYARRTDAMAPLERALYAQSFLGNVQEAQKSLEVLLRETPHEPLVLYGLALCLLQCDTESFEVRPVLQQCEKTSEWTRFRSKRATFSCAPPSSMPVE